MTPVDTKTRSNSDQVGTDKKPLPRFRRAEAPPACLLQQRDLALLQDLWHYKVLTTSQLEILRGSDPDLALRFVSRLTLTRRLKLLFHAKFVRRLARPTTGGMREPAYLLDKEGARALSRLHGEVTVRAPSQLPKLAALEHTLAINQFRASLLAACARTSSVNAVTGSPTTGVQLLQWSSGDSAKFSVALTGGDQGKAESKVLKVTLIPDGFFVLKPPSLRLFYFLEVDLGSEASRILLEKCRAYSAFWQSGSFGDAYSVGAKVGFRVLFVAPTPQRAATILATINKLEAGKTMFWVALQEEITPPDVLRPLWKNPASPEKRFGLPGQVQSFTS